MRTGNSLWLAALILTVSASAFADTVGPSSAKMDEKLGSQVPMNLIFSQRRHVPAILVLSWYHCPNLCGLVFDGLIRALPQMHSKLGNDFQIITLSIDSSEKHATAEMRKKTVLAKLPDELRNNLRPDAWPFLTGTDQAIQAISQAVGFHFAYDTGSRQFSHPAGLIVLDSNDRVIRYFGGIQFDPEILDQTIQSETRSPLVQAFMACFHFDPANGKYSAVVLRSVRVIGASFVLGLIGFCGIGLTKRTSG